MPTNTAGTQARQLPFQAVHYLRKEILYTDDGKTVDVGWIPAGSVILKPISGAHVDTAFNGNSTNTVSIGPSTDSGTDLWATSLALGTTTFVPFDENVTNLVTVDTKVQAAVTSTASASAGKAHIIIAFIPNNDR